MNRTALICTGFVLLGLASAVLVLAGPLDPPAGPVTSTHKTLSDVEPRIAINATNTPGDADSLFKITQPGSYYLTGNITGVAGKHGIEIAASGVTLDLSGFDLVGTPGMGSFDGVSVTGDSLRHITVLNGSVRDWGGDGVDLATNLTLGARVDGLHVRANGGVGLRAGAASVIANCTATSNTSDGISTSTGCTISNCIAYGNAGNGVSAGNGCTLLQCLTVNTTLIGIIAGNGSTLTSCSATTSQGAGISVAVACTLSNCAAYDNGADGIVASLACIITNCAVYSSNLNGIVADVGSSVIGCTSRSNSGSGIRVSTNSVVRGNTCVLNGAGTGDGAGVHVTGSDNHIESNACSGADRGIDVDGAGNLIIRNTCSGNTTNWTIVAGNAVAPIVPAATNGSAINGSTYTGTLASTDPNANFTY